MMMRLYGGVKTRAYTRVVAEQRELDAVQPRLFGLGGLAKTCGGHPPCLRADS